MRTEKDDKAVVAGVLSAFPELGADKGFGDAMKMWLRLARDKRRNESLHVEPSGLATCSICLSETSVYIHWPLKDDPLRAKHVIVCIPCVRDMEGRIKGFPS